MTEAFSKEVPELLQSHLDHLRASKISIDIIKMRGYRTIYGSDSHLLEMGFTKKQCRRPAGILIPMYGANGAGIVGFQYRPDNPRKITRDNGTQREIKYETPTGAENHFDIHPSVKDNAGNPQIPCWMTEGVKKGDSLVTAGAQFVISLPGVWNWRGMNKQGGRVAIPDFETVAWNGRIVYLCFDSDSWSNKDVANALQRLAALLRSRGADIRVIKLPSGPDGQKVGADDYIIQGHTLNDLIGLETQESVKPSQTLRERSNNQYAYENGYPCYVKHLSGGGTENVVLSNFSAKIIEDILEDNGLEMERYLKIIGTCVNGKIFPTIVIKESEFDGMKWARKNWGIQAVIEVGQNIKEHLRHCIELESFDAAIKIVFTHTGWREIGGKHIYLSQGGSIGEVKVDVNISSPLDKYYLPAPEGDAKNAIKTSLDFLNISKLKVTLPLWAAMYLAPLAEIIPPAFTLWYCGPSGSYKSVLTALALSHFGNFNHLGLIASWRDTVNALEKKLFIGKDVPTVVDDWAPGISNSAARGLDEKVEHITRSQGNRGGKGRMQSDTTTRKEYPPRGLLITSGEQLPGGASQTSRIFTVEIEREDTDTKLMTAAQHHKEQYRLAMAHYILWLSQQFDSLKKDLPSKWEKLRDRASSANEHPRLPEVVASLQLGFEIALLFAVEKSAIEVKDAKKLAAQCWDILTAMALEQEQRVSKESPGTRFLEGIKATVNMKSAILQEINTEGSRTPMPNQISIGWEDSESGEVWLDPLPAYQAVYQYYNRSGEPFTIKREAVWQDLRRRGLIKCKFGRTTDTRRFQGAVRRILTLRAHVLDEKEDAPSN
jgi:hypothetical protein